MYQITKDNPDGTYEVVARVDGTEAEAWMVFSSIIRGQAYEYHEKKSISKWRILRLFDPEGKQIGQES